jgi:NAD(P)H dehydrogenase (quinone)
MFAVLGANGKAGRESVRALRNRGLPVRAVLRVRAKAQEFEALGCEIAIADLGDAAALKSAFAGAEAVQAICPVAPHAADPLAGMKAHVDAICDALAATRPARALAISDYGAELSSRTGVTLAFHYLEARLREAPTSLTLLRSCEHMQNWPRVFRAAAQTGFLPSFHHPVTKMFPMVSAMDVGLVAADLLATGGAQAAPRIVHVEGPRRYSGLDVARTLGGALEREIVARAVPRSEWIDVLVRGGLSAGYAGLVAELYDAHNAGLIDVERGATDIRRGATEFADLSIFQPGPLRAATIAGA